MKGLKGGSQEPEGQDPEKPEALGLAPDQVKFHHGLRGGPFSLLFFLWVSPTMTLGRQRPLRPGESVVLPSKLRAETLSEQFREYRAKGCLVPAALWKVFGPQTLKAVGIASIGVMAKLAATLVLRRITLSVMDTSIPVNEALAWAVGLWALSVIDAIALTHATLVMCETMMGVYNVFAMETYAKAHRLHPFSRDKYKRGNLVTLGLTDAGRLVEMAFILVTGMVIPLQLAGSITLALLFVGPEILFMLIWMVVIVAVFVVAGKLQMAKFMEKQVMAGKRLSMCNEMLQSMKMVKLGAWEEFFQMSLQRIRRDEERAVRHFRYWQNVISIIAASLPALSLMTILPIYIALRGRLPSIPDTFALIHILRAITVPFTFLGMFIGVVAWLKSACARLTGLLDEPSLPPRLQDAPAAGEQVVLEDLAVRVRKGDFSWRSEAQALKAVDLEVRRGELVFVVGHLGQGKSSLLQALLGEMVSPEVVPDPSCEPAAAASALDWVGGVAYAAQQAFVTSSTLRENVLFGLPMEQGRYEAALSAAGLDLDLELLPRGDETEIGEKGVTLSGGQRARVGLARAAYSGAQVQLLDDPFAALDMEVGKHVFESLLCGVLKGATRIVTSSQLHMLSDSRIDRILVIKDGAIVQDGVYSVLANQAGTFQELQKFSSMSSREVAKGKDEPSPGPSPRGGTGKNGRVTVDEKKEVGAVSLKTLWAYRRMVGSIPVCLAVASLVVLSVLGDVVGDFWLSLWQSDSLEQSRTFYLSVWCGLVVLGLLGMLVSRMTAATVAARAATKIHNAVLARVLRCPMSFFDQTPTGRLLSRFGEDQMGLDVQLGAQCEAVLMVTAKTLVTCLVVALTVPYVMLMLAFLVPACWVIADYQRSTVRESMRWWLMTKGPLCTTFEESLSGMTTIRAFQQEGRFAESFTALLDLSSAWNYTRFCANAWGEQRLMLSSSCMVGSAAVVLVLTRESVLPAQGAMALMYAFLLGEILRFLTAMGAQAESQLAAVERAQQVLQAPQEAARVLESDAALEVSKPGASVAFDDVFLKYQEHMDPALCGVTFTVEAGERVGIVGRSGSGKSTVLLALMRLVEPCQGTIKVAGIDVASMGLRMLRSTVTVIPQDPVMFSGELQKNLDPTGVYVEESVAAACARAGLKEMRETFSLTEIVQENGSNFSHGERQLVCMARALLCRNPVMLFDEATASVDVENDARLQTVLREDFPGSTIITVAHRLNTIIDYDRIMALSCGQVVEFAPPAELMRLKDGVFAGLAREAGLLLEILPQVTV